MFSENFRQAAKLFKSMTVLHSPQRLETFSESFKIFPKITYPVIIRKISEIG